MNDRLGSMDVEADTGNIRYYGANPNNYIDIGDYYTEDTVINNMEKNSVLISMVGITDRELCYAFFDCDTNYSNLGNAIDFYFEDAASCKKTMDYESTEEICGTVTKKAGDPVLYRIIGLFKNVKHSDGTTKDLIKIIREDSIGNFAWDLETPDFSSVRKNDWNEATLNNILKNNYLANSPSVTHYYYSFLIEDFKTITSDFTKNGLNSLQHKFAKVVWNLGGNFNYGIYADQIYQIERENTKCDSCTYESEWTGNIALAYPSDQGYAADLSLCKETLSNYYSCNSNNWIVSVSDGDISGWLLTTDIQFPNGASYSNFGYISTSDVRYGNGVHPTLYLNYEEKIIYGDGTKINPYVLG